MWGLPCLFPCDSCGKIVEIEEIEATLYPPEYYEHGQCQDCFDKSLNEE